MNAHIVKCDRIQLSKIQSALINLYQQVFAEPPEYQVWTQPELVAIFNHYVLEGRLFVAKSGDLPIGFCASIPLTASKIWQTEASDGFRKYTIDDDFLCSQFGFGALHAWYIGDLGVDRLYRHQGIATRLMQAVIQSGHPALIRVSLCRESAIALYKKLGFKPMSLFQTAGYKQADGKVKAFEKMLMILS